MSSPPAAPVHQPMIGIGLKVLSVIIFVGMQTALKTLGETIPAGQLVFFRSFFALVPVVIYLAYLGEFRTALRTDDIGGHFLRGIIGVTSMGLGFFALSRLPYPEWIAISYASPLLTVIFAALFLKETVRAYRWAAVLVGLFGILVVAAPNFTLTAEHADPDRAYGILASIGGAAFAAIAMIQVRRLVRKERTPTIVVYFSLTSSLVALSTIVFGWVWPNPAQLAALVISGLCGGVAQLLLTACYRYADTSTIAPFEYTSMLLAIAIGVQFFGETIQATTLIGAAIVIGSGVFIIYREHRLGIERRKARRVSSPQG
ncbi:membrane protein [Aureimonas ureilytica]|uniref:Membrane protein n=1 Tax=Aureimonas ureilytica TaxID=401562 RepID=A0A175RNB5_9HYPH|nr:MULTISPECIES: DMT family transporter [Aureimonas]KTQ85324.1 membrane protein [Aureimonas ureilytica]KTR04941.1 membrane protein [Aureimonas ureilytica]